MDLYKLKQFITVCEENSITKAAEKLFTSQPSLSRTILNLEKQHNCRFFHREGNRLRLTENGQKFYSFAKQTLNSYEALLEEFDAREENGLLRFCYDNTSFAQFVFSRFGESETGFIAHQVKTEDIRAVLVSGKYDIALTVKPVQDERLHCVQLIRILSYISLPQDHPLAKRKKLSFSDLNGEKIVYLNNRNLEGLQRFTALLHQSAPEHKVIADLDEYSFKTMRNRLGGIYFINTLQRFSYDDPDRVLVYVDEPRIEQVLYLAYASQNRQRVEPFLTFVYGFLNGDNKVQ